MCRKVFYPSGPRGEFVVLQSLPCKNVCQKKYKQLFSGFVNPKELSPLHTVMCVCLWSAYTSADAAARLEACKIDPHALSC